MSTASTPQQGGGIPGARSVRDSGAVSAQYCLFQRYGQAFCIDVTYLQEVLQQSNVTSVPQSHPALAGVMNLRGEVLPVLLVDSWLHLPEQAYDPSHPVLVLRRGNVLLGVQVDSVQRIGNIPRAEVLASPLSGQSPIWAGIWFRAGQELTTMLDGNALISVVCSQIVSQSSNPSTPHEAKQAGGQTGTIA